MSENLLKYFNNDELAASVWENKYAKRNINDELLEETPDDMHKRMAKEFARVEKKFIDKPLHKKRTWKNFINGKPKFSDYWYKRKDLDEEKIYQLFKDFKYIVPAGSVMSGLGSEKPVSLSNCFVLPSPEDSYSSINLTRLYQTELMKRRGGVGYDLSNLRSRGAKVNNAAITSTGAASFMDVCSDVTNEVAQQGRRGALMLSMNIKHPDIQEFIEKKQDLTKVTGANVSVQVTDEFMEAVEKDETYILRWPVDAVINEHLTEKANSLSIQEQEYGKLYNMIYGSSEFDSRAKAGYMKKVRARDLWNKLIHCAWNTAEPGIIFCDRMHNYSPDGIYPKYMGIATNPCVTGDTLVQTDQGKLLIKDIIEKINKYNELIKVLSYDINNDVLEYQPINSGDLTRKNANIIEIETEDGDILKLTPDHKVYTENRGYIKASELTENDILLSLEDKFIEKYKKIKIKRISIIPNEDVYDITVEKNHNFFANNILVHNCGEIYMSGNESCRLINLNLLSFVIDPFTDKSCIDKTLLYNLAYEAMRLGDDLVELENEAVSKIIEDIKDDEFGVKIWKEILAKGISGRRVGLGFTALADMIAALNIKFATEEGNKVVKDICKILTSAILDCQADMAIERGKFPDESIGLEIIDANEWYNFIKEEFPNQWKRMMTYGRRNICATTIPPAGSVSLMTRTTSGIEPLFMPYYTRRKKCVLETDRVDYVDKLGIKFSEYVVVHPQLERWAKQNMADYINNFTHLTEKEWQVIYKKSPWYESCAQDIDWEKRVELQGIIQQYYTQHSISSTVNLPNTVTEEEVSNIYMTAWKNGLKGITVYRDGCREGILVQREEKKEEAKFLNNIDAPKRPKTLDADFYVTSVKGEKFFVIVGLFEDKPYEVFLYKPKDNEKTNYNQHKGTITKVRRGYYTFKSDELIIENISSDLTNEEYTLSLMSSMLMRHGANIKFICKTVEKIDDNITSFSSAMRRILLKYVKEQVIEGEVCPDCGGKLVRENGCIHCIDCGWSKCG